MHCCEENFIATCLTLNHNIPGLFLIWNMKRFSFTPLFSFTYVFIYLCQLKGRWSYYVLAKINHSPAKWTIWYIYRQIFLPYVSFVILKTIVCKVKTNYSFFFSSELSISPSSTSAARAPAPNNDFVETLIEIVFYNGTREANAQFTIIDDNVVENEKRFTITMSLVSGCCLPQPLSIDIVLTDDDGNRIAKTLLYLPFLF